MINAAGLLTCLSLLVQEWLWTNLCTHEIVIKTNLQTLHIWLPNIQSFNSMCRRISVDVSREYYFQVQTHIFQFASNHIILCWERTTYSKGSVREPNLSYLWQCFGDWITLPWWKWLFPNSFCFWWSWMPAQLNVKLEQVSVGTTWQYDISSQGVYNFFCSGNEGLSSHHTSSADMLETLNRSNVAQVMD